MVIVWYLFWKKLVIAKLGQAKATQPPHPHSEKFILQLQQIK